MDTTESERTLPRVPSLAPSFRLLYTGGQILAEPLVRALPIGATKIGRDTDERQGIRLPQSRRASREHAICEVLSATGNGAASAELSVRIHDLGSKNGTMVNGVPCDTAVLRDGDLVRIGDSLLLLRYEHAHQPDAVIELLKGCSAPMRALRKRVADIAAAPAPVLILGESGTGKELVARALHARSGRPGPFVPINCSTIPAALAESQLFGHLPGSFTGAVARHDGFFRAAAGGTLFLDELGELPLRVQPKLLRVLEDQTISAVGATHTTRVDVRIIAATNRELHSAGEAGSSGGADPFRSDLYARLCGLIIRPPPLRTRREDILLHFAAALGPAVHRLTTALAEALVLYSWPLNVRELMQLAVHLKYCAADALELDLPLLAERLMQSPSAAGNGGVPLSADSLGNGDARAAVQGASPPPKPLPREEVERLLHEHHGIVARVAVAAGRSPRQIRRWIEHYGLCAKPSEG